MDEEFESLVVTDPDIVDPGIDVSGLRTQTDVSPYLLGNIPDYAGIQYEAFNPSRLSDLMRLYSSGLPAIDTSTAAPPATGGGGGDSGGGGATIPVTPITPITPINPIPPAGGGADMGTVPVTQPDTGGITSDPIEMENIMDYENPYDVPMNVDDPGASIENILQPNPSGTIPGRTDIFDINQTGDPALNPGSVNVGQQPMAAGPFDYLQEDSISTVANPEIFDSYAGVNDPQIKDPGFTGYIPSFDTSGLTDATPEQRNTIQNILTAAGDNVQGALTELGKIPGAVVDFANQTVDFFGKKLNVGKTLAGLALNKMVGGPATLVFELAKNILPEGNIAPSTNIARSTGLLQGDTTVTKDKYGINTQTSFDPVQSTINYNEYNVEQVEKLENRLEELKTDKYTKDGVFNEQAYLDNTKRMRQELEDRKEYLDTVNKDPLYGGDIDERDQMLEDIVAQNKIDEGTEFVDTDGGGEFDTTPTTTGDNPFADIDTGVKDFDTTPVDEFSDEAFMVGDTSTAAPTTGDSGADSFFDAVDTSIGGGGGRDRDPDPSPSFDPGGGFVDQGGGGEFGGAPSSPVSTAGQAGPPSQRGGGGNGGSSSGGGGCVIATHAVNSGAFTKDTKREAVRWCIKNLHRTWWGEAIRRGYRYYGQKAPLKKVKLKTITKNLKITLHLERVKEEH